MLGIHLEIRKKRANQKYSERYQRIIDGKHHENENFKMLEENKPFLFPDIWQQIKKFKTIRNKLSTALLDRPQVPFKGGVNGFGRAGVGMLVMAAPAAPAVRPRTVHFDTGRTSNGNMRQSIGTKQLTAGVGTF